MWKNHCVSCSVKLQTSIEGAHSEALSILAAAPQLRLLVNTHNSDYIHAVQNIVSTKVVHLQSIPHHLKYLTSRCN